MNSCLHIHPRQSIKAEVKQERGGEYRWLSITVDDIEVVIHPPATSGKLCIEALADALAVPARDIEMDKQAAEHDRDESNAEPINDQEVPW